MFREGQAVITRREDYQAPAFLIDSVDLVFDLEPAKTRVLNTMQIRRNPDLAAQALKLDGEELNLSRVLVNGQGTSFKMDGDQLVLENLPEGNEAFKLEIFTTCNPSKNTQLTGLYMSQDSFFTQCEAQGFRRISYFLDRPDVMSTFTTCVVADEARYPILLSNGNAVARGREVDGRHWVRWEDPFRKPCYLFALVAGNLACVEDSFTTSSGRAITLRIFVEDKDVDKCDHAMLSLKNAMAWDEKSMAANTISTFS